MIKFAVYQSNKPATALHYGLADAGWDNCIFNDLKDAIKYAQGWCGPNYPVVPDAAGVNLFYQLPFKAIDGSIEFIIIRAYKTNVHTEHCCDVHKVCKYGDEDCPCCCDVPIPATFGCNCDNY